MTFQSTLPLRGATYSYWISPSVQIFQSTLPLRGATIGGFQHFVPAEISIHTPLAGSDLVERVPSALILEFQSTLPLRGATRTDGAAVVLFEISIHTPLAGSDLTHASAAASGEISIHTPLAGSDSPRRRAPGRRWHFNPHSPCGERPQK